MTTTTLIPTQAELDTARDIESFFGFTVSDKVRRAIVEILIAHRADPVMVYAEKLEDEFKMVNTNAGGR